MEKQIFTIYNAGNNNNLFRGYSSVGNSIIMTNSNWNEFTNVIIETVPILLQNREDITSERIGKREINFSFTSSQSELNARNTIKALRAAQFGFTPLRLELVDLSPTNAELYKEVLYGKLVGITYNIQASNTEIDLTFTCPSAVKETYTNGSGTNVPSL